MKDFFFVIPFNGSPKPKNFWSFFTVRNEVCLVPERLKNLQVTFTTRVANLGANKRLRDCHKRNYTVLFFIYADLVHYLRCFPLLLLIEVLICQSKLRTKRYSKLFMFLVLLDHFAYDVAGDNNKRRITERILIKFCSSGFFVSIVQVTEKFMAHLSTQKVNVNGPYRIRSRSILHGVKSLLTTRTVNNNYFTIIINNKSKLYIDNKGNQVFLNGNFHQDLILLGYCHF